jgi:hypothetical protein
VFGSKAECFRQGHVMALVCPTVPRDQSSLTQHTQNQENQAQDENQAEHADSDRNQDTYIGAFKSSPEILEPGESLRS